MDKDNQTFIERRLTDINTVAVKSLSHDHHDLCRVSLSNNWDSIEPINTNECRRQRFVDGCYDVEPKTPDITISKEKYDYFRRHVINDNELDYYEEQDKDPLTVAQSVTSPIIKPTPLQPPPPPTLKRTFASERIPSESFGEELIRTTKINRTRIEKEKEYKKKIFDEKVENRYNELMEFLTNKYYEQVVSCLKYNAENGKHQAYMNFTYEDFKANMPTLGNPKEIQRKWLKEIKTPSSKFLKGRRPLQDISVDCWGNAAFTVHFKWQFKIGDELV